MQSAILSEVSAGWCPSCDWLQHSRMLYKIGPVLSFPYTSPAAAARPSNTLWYGLELALGVNSTKFVLICYFMACGCGCRICLRQPLASYRSGNFVSDEKNNVDQQKVELMTCFSKTLSASSFQMKLMCRQDLSDKQRLSNQHVQIIDTSFFWPPILSDSSVISFQWTFSHQRSQAGCIWERKNVPNTGAATLFSDVMSVGEAFCFLVTHSFCFRQSDSSVFIFTFHASFSLVVQSSVKKKIPALVLFASV